MALRLAVLAGLWWQCAATPTFLPSAMPTPAPSALPSQSFEPTGSPSASPAPTSIRVKWHDQDCSDEEDRIEARFKRIAITLGTLIVAMAVAMIVMGVMISIRAKCEIDLFQHSGKYYTPCDCCGCGDPCAVADPVEAQPGKSTEMPARPAF